jgi:hypothetical protein
MNILGNSTPSTNLPSTPSTPSTNLPSTPSTPSTSLPGGFFSGKSLSGSDIKDKSDNLNPGDSIIDLKKQESTTLNAPKTTANQDLKKVGKVTLSVLIKLAAIIGLSSLFSYYCIISYAHLMPTIDPKYDFTDIEQAAHIASVKKLNGKNGEKGETKDAHVKNPFLPNITITRAINNKPIPVYVSKETKDNKLNTNCGGIVFSQEDINQQFAGYYDGDVLKKTDVSLLYSINSSMSESYEDVGFIKNALIKFFQNMVITDFRIITTYFEFFRSFCSEGFSLLFGWIFLIPFMFVFIVCHCVASGWYWLHTVMELFKTKDCSIENKNKIPDPKTGKISAKCIGDSIIKDGVPQTKLGMIDKIKLMFPFKYFFDPPKDTYIMEPGPDRKTENLTTWEWIARFAFAYISPWIISFISIFCAWYSLFMSLLIKGVYDRPPHKGADKKTIDEKRKTFSIFSYIANNIKFYSRAYLLLFTALLVYESYVDMNMNTALGCIIAIIIVVFGTSVFKKLTMDDLLFTSGQEDKCYDPSASKEPDSKVPAPTSSEVPSADVSASLKDIYPSVTDPTYTAPIVTAVTPVVTSPAPAVDAPAAITAPALDAASTSDAPAASTSDAPAASTSDAPAASTSDAPAASTSDAPTASTSDAPTASTSDAPAASTSDAPGASTSDAPGASTAVTASASD